MSSFCSCYILMSSLEYGTCLISINILFRNVNNFIPFTTRLARALDYG